MRIENVRTQKELLGAVNQLLERMSRIERISTGPGTQRVIASGGPAIFQPSKPAESRRTTGGDTSWWAKITGATADGDRWKYTWVEVEKTIAGYEGWTTKSGGRSGTADARNGDENPTADYAAVPTNTVVRMRSVVVGEATEYWFCSNEDVGGSGDSGFWGIVTGKTAASGRWTYEVKEAEKNDEGYDWKVKASGGQTVTALNGAEQPDPTEICPWRPVPLDSIVWVREFDSEYWFNESMNQDCNPDATKDVILLYLTDPGTEATVLWDITDSGGEGISKDYIGALFWNSEDGSLCVRKRTEHFDDSGRLVKITGGSAALPVVVGRICYEPVT